MFRLAADSVNAQGSDMQSRVLAASSDDDAHAAVTASGVLAIHILSTARSGSGATATAV
jgi:hypothetical protein